MDIRYLSKSLFKLKICSPQMYLIVGLGRKSFTQGRTVIKVVHYEIIQQWVHNVALKKFQPFVYCGPVQYEIEMVRINKRTPPKKIALRPRFSFSIQTGMLQSTT
jgi:hypothetical protein